MAKRASKKQTELAGLERPSIPALDELCAAHLEASDTLAEAKESASQAKQSLKQAMEEHRHKLETNDDGNHVYAYHDGDERTVVVLFHEEGIRCRRDKKRKLELVEDGEIG